MHKDNPEVNADLFLESLRVTNFDWTCSLGGVWDDSMVHVADLNQDFLQDCMTEIERLSLYGSATNPLGKVLLGVAGSGKTHLLGALRRRVISQGIWFVLCDMTDINDFWSTLALEYVQSLDQTIEDDKRQVDFLMERIFDDYGLTQIVPTFQAFCQIHKDNFKPVMNQAIARLLRQQRPKKLIYVDVLRALLMFCHEDFDIMEAGYSWLQGVGVEASVCESMGLTRETLEPAMVVEGLAWVMSLGGPTLLAFDQLDAIVSQNTFSVQIEELTKLNTHLMAQEFQEQNLRALSIIHGISGGLMGVRDRLAQTLTVVSCLEETWNVLRSQAVQSLMDRFAGPYLMKPLSDVQQIQSLISGRLQRAYQMMDLRPIYPSFPFHPHLFYEWVGLTPRMVLKECESHRSQCLKQQEVIERLPTEALPESVVFDQSVLEPVRQRFEELKSMADLGSFKQEFVDSDVFELAIQNICKILLIQEEPGYSSRYDGVVDTQFSGHGSKPLHARLRFIDHQQGDRETHYAFRALQHANARAFQTRLNASVTASGIDKALSFRHLVVVRTQKLPSGQMTLQMIAHFKAAGGIFYKPSDEELIDLWALSHLYQESMEGFHHWVKTDRPVVNLPLFKMAGIYGEHGEWGMALDDATNSLEDPLEHSLEYLQENSLKHLQEHSPEHLQEHSLEHIQDEERVGDEPIKQLLDMSLLKEPVPSNVQPEVTLSHDLLMSDLSSRDIFSNSDLPSIHDSLRIKDELKISDSPNKEEEPAMSVFPVGWHQDQELSARPEVYLNIESLRHHTCILTGAGTDPGGLVVQLMESVAQRHVPVLLVDVIGDSSENDFPERENTSAFQTFQALPWLPTQTHSSEDLIFQRLVEFREQRLEFDPVIDLSVLLDNEPLLYQCVDWICQSLSELLKTLKGESLKPKEKSFLGRAVRAFILQERCGIESLARYMKEMTKSQSKEMANMSLSLANRLLDLSLLIPDLLQQEREVQSLNDHGDVLRGKQTNPFNGVENHVHDDGELPMFRVAWSGGEDHENLETVYWKLVAMNLITWMKAASLSTTSPREQGVEGVIVINQAEKLIPSRMENDLKSLWMEVTRQATVCGFGLVFVTQEPVALETALVEQCSTQFFGKVRSPAAVQQIENYLKRKDQSLTREELKTLRSDQYYVFADGFHHAKKIDIRALELEEV